MLHEKSVGGIIFRDEAGVRLFLLLHYQRRNDQRGDHTYWDLPKGHVEEGETEVHTLFREVEEETGITDLQIVEGFREPIKYFFNLKGTLVNKQVIFYLAQTATPTVTISSEHIGYAWLSLDEAHERLTFDNAKKILTKAHEFLGVKRKLTDW